MEEEMVGAGRVVCYYQTYFPDNGTKLVSMLPLCTNNSGVTHIILAAIHLNERHGDITLNDDSPYHPRYTPLWAEVSTMQTMGVKFLGMLGGAAKGSYQRLDGSPEKFEQYYIPLRDMIRSHRLDGLDLDVEEEMSLEGIIRLIDRLKQDFGRTFIITLAPVATALIRGQRHLSGFSYAALEERRSDQISWYNTQFYNGWGSISDTRMYKRIMQEGWPPNKVVIGILTNPRNGSQGYVPLETAATVLSTLIQDYTMFGGVAGWEYFNALPGGQEKPWQWASSISLLLGMKLIRDIALAKFGKIQR
ncbi:hypothetical protein FQN57_002929 [Myotisia sp. PD_48]|nr:hypothetical protein FQN57_002929 [Myotisia sp. PD_48]